MLSIVLTFLAVAANASFSLSEVFLQTFAQALPLGHLRVPFCDYSDLAHTCTELEEVHQNISPPKTLYNYL